MSRKIVKRIAKKYATSDSERKTEVQRIAGKFGITEIQYGDLNIKVPTPLPECSIKGCHSTDISSHYDPETKDDLNLCQMHFYRLFLIMRDSN